MFIESTPSPKNPQLTCGSFGNQLRTAIGKNMMQTIVGTAKLRDLSDRQRWTCLNRLFTASLTSGRGPSVLTQRIKSKLIRSPTSGRAPQRASEDISCLITGNPNNIELSSKTNVLSAQRYSHFSSSQGLFTHSMLAKNGADRSKHVSNACSPFHEPHYANSPIKT